MFTFLKGQEVHYVPAIPELTPTCTVHDTHNAHNEFNAVLLTRVGLDVFECLLTASQKQPVAGLA